MGQSDPCRQPSGDTHESQLRTLGYTIVEGVLTASEVAELREVVDALYRTHDPAIDYKGLDVRNGRPDGTAPRETDLRRDYNLATNLLAKHSSTWKLLDREPILGLIRSIVGPDCVLSSLNSLEPLMGAGHQPLHRDEGPVGPDGFVTANSIWVLDPMDAGNGATRLVPRTHLTDEMANDADPRLLYAQAESGSVVVTNAHILHGASLNKDGRRRRVIHAYFTRRGRAVQTDLAYYSSPAALAALPPNCRGLLQV
jgi:ectoine hydroxylase-related dioxygenase (phytanoyl-CoA dioxygenase family)